MFPRKPRRRRTAQKLQYLRRKQPTEEPAETYAILQQQLKGEDVLFVIDDVASKARDRTDLGHWSVYAVCDGHGGATAAKFVREHLESALAKVLPSGNPPPIRSNECKDFCRAVRHALVKAFVSLHDAFGSEGCRASGTTVSVSLLCDWLLTTANVADSEVFLDLGHSIMEMSNCHKVDQNKREITRLQVGGADLRRLSSFGPGPAMEGDAGRGPLRVWPGGIAMSRSLGDLDCDAQIVPVPHVRQIWIPNEGARLIMASDGLWDHVSGAKACRLIRSVTLLESPQRLMEAALAASGGHLTDDLSILVLDVMPQEGVDFTERRFNQSGMFRSLQGYLRHPSLHGKIKMAKRSDLYADMDGLTEYPDMSQNIVPAICDVPKPPVESEDDSHSRNSSLASENWDVCECSWDCSAESSTSWEKDERDLYMDTAQAYVTATSNQNRQAQSVKMVLKHPVSRREVHRTDSASMRDFFDTSMTSTDSATMRTIYEPDGENDDTIRS